MSQDHYRVVYVEPGKPAREMMLGKNLKALQQAVGGYIELIRAHGDRTVIVGNDEAKLIGMEGNRWLETGSIIAGPFLYKENHSLYEWFNEAYGGEQEIPATINERSANCSKLRNRDSSPWDE